MRHLFYTLIFVSALAGCNTVSTEEEQQLTEIETLKAEIMESHDTTMAEMNHMGKLRSRLKEMKGDTTASTADTAAYQETYIALMRANGDMMEWMAQFENPDEMLVTNAEKIAYLKDQKAKMKAIEEQTFSAIKEADGLIEK
jgi:glutathionylspermidine synthase